MKWPLPPTEPVNLWTSGAVNLEELREIVAMLVDQAGFKIVATVDPELGRLLFLEKKGYKP